MYLNISNDSLQSFHNMSGEFKPKVAIFQAIVIILFSMAIIVCNVVLIMAVLRTPNLHTKTNALLVSVSLSEVMLGVFVMPFIASLLIKPSLRFSSGLCDFIAFMTSVQASSRALSMFSVAVDRCVAISHPLQYNSCITRKTITLFAAIVWILSIIFAVFPYINVGKYSFLTVYGRCMIDYHVSSVFAIVKEVTCTLVPSIGVFITFVIVITEARSHHRVTMIAQLAIAMYSGPVRGVNYTRSTFKALRTYLVISCIYLFTCFPRSLYVISVSANQRHSNSLFTFFTFLTYICSISTPLVISTLNIKFRQSIVTLFESKNKVNPISDYEPYTISTGLHTILEHSMVFKCVPNKDQKFSKMSSFREPVAGPSRQLPIVRFQPRRVSVLHEAQSSSSSGITVMKPGHAVLRKTLSSPS
ncbi:probable G-protein coupled receptor 21 [Ruditapes philippinarum]|uniref:probable G-protein coupled receptor 21 n=1 Tax=Ruditapes philippinarum TaxID=129788 RepID=UPI00295AD079|nr:probable G-protein coupled receptor 21 [Ruditapes philippinarum]